MDTGSLPKKSYDMKKIDIHLHVSSNSQQNDAQMQVSSGLSMLPHLHKLGICHGILMSGGENPGSLPVGTNESNRELCATLPESYHWMCNIDECNQETIFDRLLTYKRQGAVGIGEFMINKRLDHPFIQEVFRCAEQLELPALIHMSPEEGYQYGVVDEPGLPLLEKVLKRYPGMKLIGHSQPFWHEISGGVSGGRDERNSWGKGKVMPGGRVVELLEKYKNLYGDLSANSGGCAIMRDEAFGLWFLERFSDRLFFGTDMVNTQMEFPLGQWLDEQFLKGKLSHKAHRQICRENAAAVFHLNLINE